jgi:hypothetical protein
LEKVEGCVVWVCCHCKSIGHLVKVTIKLVAERLLYKTRVQYIVMYLPVIV